MNSPSQYGFLVMLTTLRTKSKKIKKMERSYQTRPQSSNGAFADLKVQASSSYIVGET